MFSEVPPIWRTPEELITAGFGRSSVVMMNEAHSGLTRCIRTREVGQQILPATLRWYLESRGEEAFIFLTGTTWNKM